MPKHFQIRFLYLPIRFVSEKLQRKKGFLETSVCQCVVNVGENTKQELHWWRHTIICTAIHQIQPNLTPDGKVGGTSRVKRAELKSSRRSQVHFSVFGDSIFSFFRIKTLLILSGLSVLFVEPSRRTVIRDDLFLLSLLLLFCHFHYRRMVTR